MLLLPFKAGILLHIVLFRRKLKRQILIPNAKITTAPNFIDLVIDPELIRVNAI